ncbi:MAG: hypothetical protein R2941_13275 [Desulfobacterales bacterium]
MASPGQFHFFRFVQNGQYCSQFRQALAFFMDTVSAFSAMQSQSFWNNGFLKNVWDAESIRKTLPIFQFGTPGTA